LNLNQSKLSAVERESLRAYLDSLKRDYPRMSKLEFVRHKRESIRTIIAARPTRESRHARITRTLHIPNELNAKLAAIASDQYCSIHRIILLAIREYVERNESE
jgi:hypothetical protein